MESEDLAAIDQAYEQVNNKIRRCTTAAGREPGAVRLIAVSKKQPVSRIIRLANAGQISFGENYAQELAEKAAALEPMGLNWSYLGQLQSNKIRTVVRWAHEIHSVASFRHAGIILRHAKELGKLPFPVFILVNAGQEPQKGGIAPGDLPDLAGRISTELKGLQLKGIMTIPPKAVSLEADAGPVPAIYKESRKMADTTGEGLLSLGMSHDLETALKAGSDILRIGTDLFGKRPE